MLPMGTERSEIPQYPLILKVMPELKVMMMIELCLGGGGGGVKVSSTKISQLIIHTEKDIITFLWYDG